MKNDLPKRKPNRLKGFDYSSDGAYFITICTKNKEQCLSKIVGANIVRPSSIGKIIEKDILKIEKIYPCIFVDSYVIMPNHIHLLLRIDTIRRPMVAPTIATVIKQFKGAVSKEVGMSVWQKGFSTILFVMMRIIKLNINTLMKIRLNGQKMNCIIFRGCRSCRTEVRQLLV